MAHFRLFLAPFVLLALCQEVREDFGVVETLALGKREVVALDRTLQSLFCLFCLQDFSSSFDLPPVHHGMIFATEVVEGIISKAALNAAVVLGQAKRPERKK